MRYGRWRVLCQAAHPRKWTCQCDCGTIRDVAKYSLTSGVSQSCGCYHKEVSSTPGRGKRYDNYGPGTVLYRLLTMVKRRANDLTNSKYGGRGITLYPAWQHDMQAFIDYVLALPGCPPKSVLNAEKSKLRKLGLSLDRRNNDRGYVPGNLRWATHKQQQRNRRNTVYVRKGVTLAEVCEQRGLHYGTVHARIFRYGWSINDALTKPSKRHGY